MSKSSFILTPLILFLFSILLSACGQEQPGGVPSTASERSFEVDIQFREPYEEWGGAGVLGPVVSPAFADGDRRYQFTQSALMVFDPQYPAIQRFHLAPLGRELGISEPPASEPPEVGLVYVDGYLIHPEIIAFYEKMGGARFAGRPLSGPHYNPEKKRYEQYFENVGFYHQDGTPSGSAHLLPYGAWKCGQDCRSQPSLNSVIQVLPPVEQPFLDAVSRLGADLTGFPLTEAYMAADGQVEQVFENLVLYYNPASPTGQVGLRPMLEMLGRLPDPLQPPSSDGAIFFYAVQGDQGYNVPQDFIDFIEPHGGLVVTGAPISQVFPGSNGSARQCFVHLCLDEFSSGYVSAAPKGYDYKLLHYQSRQPANKPAPAGRQISLQVWENAASVPGHAPQEIGVSILENNAPLENIVPLLVVTYPDSTQKSYPMPPTGADGQSRLQIAPIDAPNGTLIPYQVCISGEGSGQQKYCFKDSYLIWNSP